MRNLIVIGSGPAGWTAAIYAARGGLAPLVFTGSEAGGQLTETTEVENFPGFPEGILGPELMGRMADQAKRFGSEVIEKTVERVDFGGETKKVWVSDECFESRAVIIATGASARRLGLESERLLYGKGVSACATCDGFFFRDRDVIVVGGGDAAMEEALDLAKFAAKVTVLARSDKLKASKIMQEKAQAESRINFVWNVEVKEVLGDGNKLTGVKLTNTQNGETSEMN